MKTMNIKLLSVLLASLTLASLIMTACSHEQTETGETAETTTAAETAAAETTAPGDVPDIPEADWNGEEFRVLYPSWSLYLDYYFAEEEKGEAVNDAIYVRTSKVEEAIGIDIVGYSNGDVDKTIPLLKSTVLAGDDTFDLNLTHNSTSMTAHVSEGLIRSWEDIPYVDMTKDYWNMNAHDTLMIDGVLCFASNALILPDINALFYHKGMAESFGLGDIYTLVSNGSWTWEKLREMSAVVTGDADGDGQMTADDRYGLVFELGWQDISMLTSIDEYFVTKNDAGVPELTINNEKVIGFVEMIYDMINGSKTAYKWRYSVETDPNVGGKPPVAFESGYALFYLTPLSLAKTFRETELDFGIIPLPKYDEAQDDYKTLSWSGFITVPMTASNLEMIGMATELLGYYNHEIVWPAFYDVLLGQKISRDAQSVEMLDIIFNNTVYDIGVVMGYGLLAQVLRDDGNFVSKYESVRSGYEESLKEFVTAHTEYAEAHTAK